MTEREFNRHIESIRPRLVGFASSFIGVGAATAEDMVQDAVVKVWGQRDKVQNMDALMIVVLRNVCLDYLRLQKNRTRNNVELSQCGVVVYNGQDPQKKMEISDQLHFVRTIIAQLPSEQQMVLRLRDVMGYEFAEIAKIMDIAEGNARVLLSRARKQVRETMLNGNKKQQYDN